MPPPEEKPRPKPEPKPKPKPPKPKKAPEPEPEPEPMPRRDVTPGGAGSYPPDPFSCVDNCSGPCALLPHCQPPSPPSSPGTALKLTSSRLPTPLIAVSASLLVFCAVLLLALLVRCLVQRRRRRLMRAQNGPLAQHGEEGGQQQVLAGGAAAEGAGVEDDDLEAADGAVHHVWYIRTKGLDERAIAAIAAVVYDAKKPGAVGGGGDDDASCAVCLADFRDGETLRLLPRCGHAFHRACIDTWLRAHVNCPLCRAPVQVPSAAAPAPGTAATAAAPRGEGEASLGAVGGVRTEEETARSGVPERAVRRAASMVALPRRAWPDVSFRAPTSNSGREEDMSGLGKIMRLLKLSDSPAMNGVGAGRSVSFSVGSCQRLPTRSGPSAAGVSADEMPQ